MITQITGSGSAIVRIEDDSMGIVLKNIRKDSTIKVDLVSKTGEDRNVFPQMTLQEYAELFVSLTVRDAVNSTADGTAYEAISFLFSVAGALPLNEDEYYNVSLGNLNNRSIEVHNLDSLFSASFAQAIQVDRYDIKASLSEKAVPTAGYAMAYFPNEQPTKMEAHVNNRKVTFGIEQISLFNRENRMIEVDKSIPNPAFTLGTEKLSYPVLQTEEMTIHKGGNEMIFYLVKA